MDKNIKLILILTGSVVVAAAIGFGIYFLIRKKKEQTGNGNSDTNPFVTPEQTSAATGSESGYVPLINPTFNVENELSNPTQQLRGRTLYPKEKAMGGQDYANVRSSAEVNTDQGWWDKGNKIATIYKGSGIGKVISDTTSLLSGYPYRWFKVKLLRPLGGHTEGFVRSDTVTFRAVF